MRIAQKSSLKAKRWFHKRNKRSEGREKGAIKQIIIVDGRTKIGQNGDRVGGNCG